MKTIHYFFVLTFALAGLSSCGDSQKPAAEAAAPGVDSLQIEAAQIFQPLPAQADAPDNPITAPKVALGKMLYYDTRLSAKGNNSCNSCHNLNTFGVDQKPTSPGDDGKNGNRNSPTTLNAALHISQFWDGRANTVEEQAGMPILNPDEMHIPNEAFLVKRLKGVAEYPKLFAEAFPDDKNPLTYKNITRAIAAFERTLITPSRFDDYLAGNTEALTKEEKDGLKTFMYTGCTTCHTGSTLGGQLMQKFAVYGNYWEQTGSTAIDSGRIAVTKSASDLFMFKVPSLRNIAETYPYFHDGSVADLSKTVSIMGKTQLNKNLSVSEVKRIVTFLKALTGEVPADAKINPLAAK